MYKYYKNRLNNRQTKSSSLKGQKYNMMQEPNYVITGLYIRNTSSVYVNIVGK